MPTLRDRYRSDEPWAFQLLQGASTSVLKSVVMGPANLPFIGGDDPLGVLDLPPQFNGGLEPLAGGLGPGDFAEGKSRGFVMFQGLAMSCDLRPMPGNLAVTVGNHVSLLNRGPNYR